MSSNAAIRYLLYPQHLTWSYRHLSDNCGADKSAYAPIGYESMTITSVESHINSFGGHCPMCGQMPTVKVSQVTDESEQGFDGTYSHEVRVCGRCGWWYGREKWDSCWYGGDGQAKDHRKAYEAIIKAFDLSCLNIPIELLRIHLASHVSDVSYIAPRTLELLLRDVYKDFYHCEVKHIGGPGDNGIDLFAVICDEPHFMQVKRRRSGEAVEGVALVREFIGTLLSQGVSRGHIVTTASRFSNAAKELANNDNVRRHQIAIELKTIDDIRDMLHLTTPLSGKPWENCARGQNEAPGVRITMRQEETPEWESC